MASVKHISEDDFLNDGRVKINEFAIDPANRAEVNSKQAINDANKLGNEAKKTAKELGDESIKIAKDLGNKSIDIANKSDEQSLEAIEIAKNTNENMNNIISEETDSSEIIAARKPMGKVAFKTVGERLDTEMGDLSTFRNESSIIEKLRNEFSDRSINVKWFGAKGDGLTNDNRSVMSAVDFVNSRGGELYFPAGVYKIDEQIHIKRHGVRIIGDGAFWKETEKYGTTILAGENFEGANLIKFEHEYGYIRSVGARDITFDGGETSDCNILTIVSGYDFINFSNVMCKNASDNKHAWNITSSDTALSQTHIYTNCVGLHRNNSAKASTVKIFNLQESIFNNFKSWASFQSKLESSASTFEIVSGSGLSFINCSSVFSKGAAIKLEVGQVGGCKNITFINHLFEDCATPFKIESHSFKCFGNMSTILEKGSIVKQGNIEGVVYLNTKTGIYIDNSTGEFEKGDIYDDSGNKIGTITTISKMKVSNITTTSTQTKFSGTEKCTYEFENILNSNFHIDTDKDKKIDIFVRDTSESIKINLDSENYVTDKGLNTIVELGNYQKYFELSKIFYLPNAIKNKSIKVKNIENFVISILPFTNQKISKYDSINIYPGTSIYFVCEKDNEWIINNFDGSFVGINLNDPNVSGSFTTKKEIENNVESKQISVNDLGKVITNKGAKKQVTMNLSKTLDSPKAEFTFIKDSEFKMFVQATGEDRFRGGDPNGFIEIEKSGQVVKVVNNEPGIWDVLGI